MTAIEKERLRLKVFIGMQLAPDLRNHLSKSNLWKQSQIGSSPDSLKEIHSNGKDYLGYYVQQEPIPLDLLKKLESEIRKNITLYCPDFNADRLPVHIFSQLFIE